MNEFLIRAVILWILAVNLLGFAIMGVDKFKAARGMWRIKEKTLFLVAALGGAVGSTMGMFGFRHKTKHWYFRLGFPLLAVIWIVLYYFILRTL